MWKASMTRIVPSRQRLQMLFQERDLYISTRAAPEVVIGNNAVLFAISEVTRQYGKRKNLSLIYPMFWLDSVHSDHLSNHWGQKIHSLPESAKKLFKVIYPNQSDDNYILWGQYQQLRQFLLDEIKKNYAVYEGMPSQIIRDARSDYTIKIGIDGSNSMHVADHAHFFNWCRIPKKHKLPSIIERPHTELYTIPRNQAPSKVIILGQGESVIWLARDFPNTQFVTIKREGDRLPTVQDNPSYQGINLQNVVVCESNDPFFDLRTANKSSTQALVTYTGKTGHYEYFEGECYTAIGLEPTSFLTKNVPEISKTELEDSFNDWMGPKEVGRGSLLQSYTKLMELTKNLNWTDQPFAFHESALKSYIADIKMKFASQGIKLPNEFFEILKKNIDSLERLPSNDEQRRLLVNIYEKITQCDQKKLHSFSTALSKILFRDRHRVDFNHSFSLTPK